MRLLHVVPTYLPATRYGGPIVAVHGLCRALAARGHEVEVFTTSIDGPNNMAVAHAIPTMLDGVKVWYFASNMLRRLSYAPSLAQALRREVKGADIVHLHSVFLWPTWKAARIARSAQVPYVLSPRGMLVRQLIEKRNRLIKLAWIALIEKANLEQASAIHATSAVEADDVKKFGWHLQRLAVVANGVEETDEGSQGRPSAEIEAIGREQPLILFFGRFAQKKGLDRLLRAFARTQRGILAIVGTDYEGMTPELAEFARELNISHRVRFLPHTITGVDKDSVFKAARVFVLPSYSENFGNTVLEALQHAVPVIVTPEVGAAEAVRESGGGLVVNGDDETLAEAMDSLTGDPALACKMGQAGRRHVRDHYGWSSVAAQMDALYQSVRASH